MSAQNTHKPTAVAQLVEQRIPNPQVAGSSPSRRDDDGGSGDGSGRARFSFGLYKFGQGYWVRMMTASMLGMLLMASALWAANELSAFPIPTPRWALPVDGASGEAAPGQTVSLYRQAEDSTPIGTATVESYTPGERVAGRLVIADVKIDAPNVTAADTRRVEISPAQGQPAAFTGGVASPIGLPAFEKIYLQAGAALLVLLVGGALTYYYVGLKPRSVDFLIATDGEMKKVNWSTKHVIWNSTTVVITATFAIAALLFIFDLALHSLARAIGLLEV